MSGYRFTFFILMLLLCGRAPADTLDIQRNEFMQAYSAVQHNKKAAADSKALKEYLLYPYLQAARLEQELQSKPAAALLDKRIAAFVDLQGAVPAVRDVRHAWLLSLAGRNEWKVFLTYYRDDGDPELRCQNVNALLAMHRDGEVPALIASLWMTGERLAAACNAPFQWGRDKQIITAALLEQRIRLALKGGNTPLARDLVEALPVTQATPLLQWMVLIENPAAGIDAAITHPDINVESAALQDGWTRLARKDQDAAMARLPGLIKARGFSDADASPFYLNLALALAWNRRSEALQYFTHVAPVDMTEQAYEWQARAALWHGDWPLVSKLINAMPTALKTQMRWRYWLVRTTERTQGIDAARAGYQQLVNTEDNYFAALAAARINAPYAPHPLAFNIDLPALQKLAALSDMHRVRELVAVQLTPQATSEWNPLILSLNNTEQLAAAALAHEWGWYEQCILITARLSQFNDYAFLYPRPFDDEVKTATTLTNLPVDFIYAQLRQESLYRRDAKSSAGAMGLMQLIPSSARLIARQLKFAKPSDEDLYKPTINIPLGAFHMKQLIDSFDGHMTVALAAYNAGPTAARRWLPDASLDSDVWIENIPFNETRTYVPRILWHWVIFEWLRTGKPVNTTAWLKPIKAS